MQKISTVKIADAIRVAKLLIGPHKKISLFRNNCIMDVVKYANIKIDNRDATAMPVIINSSE